MKISQRDRKYMDTEHIYGRGCTGKSQQSKTEYLFFFFFCQCLTAVLSTLGKAKGSNYSMPGMASATSINLDSEQGTPCTSKTFSYQTACVWTVVLQPQILHMQTPEWFQGKFSSTCRWKVTLVWRRKQKNIVPYHKFCLVRKANEELKWSNGAGEINKLVTMKSKPLFERYFS